MKSFIVTNWIWYTRDKTKVPKTTVTEERAPITATINSSASSSARVSFLHSAKKTKPSLKELCNTDHFGKKKWTVYTCTYL